jgi:hypothetical protein
MLKRLVCLVRGHRWHTFSNEEDGTRYRQCERCGKDETGGIDIGPDAAAGGLIAAPALAERPQGRTPPSCSAHIRRY